MVANARSHGAQGLPVVIVISINNRDRLLRPHAGDEATRLRDLIRAQGQLGADLRADGAIRVIPSVMDPHGDELVQPSFVQQVIEICLAQARRHAREELSVQAILQATQSAV